MFQIETPLIETVVRVALIYFVLLVMLRVTGKRQLGQLAPMDILTLLLISETVSPALTAQDPSITTAVIAAATLVICDLLVAILAFRSSRMEVLIEGKPAVLIKDGELDTGVMTKERLSMQDLEVSLRKNGVRHIRDVSLAVIETDGVISVLKLGDAA